MAYIPIIYSKANYVGEVSNKLIEKLWKKVKAMDLATMLHCFQLNFDREKIKAFRMVKLKVK